MKPPRILTQHAREIREASHLWRVSVSTPHDVFEQEITLTCICSIPAGKKSTARSSCSSETMAQGPGLVVIYFYAKLMRKDAGCSYLRSSTAACLPGMVIEKAKSSS